METPIQKAKELKAQFGDNAKYVVLEILDELKHIWSDFDSREMFGSSNLILGRINYFKEVKEQLEPKIQPEKPQQRPSQLNYDPFNHWAL